MKSRNVSRRCGVCIFSFWRESLGVQDWIALDWTGLDWIALDCGQDWAGRDSLPLLFVLIDWNKSILNHECDDSPSFVLVDCGTYLYVCARRVPHPSSFHHASMHLRARQDSICELYISHSFRTLFRFMFDVVLIFSSSNTSRQT
jgi:hypothetical protein